MLTYAKATSSFAQKYCFHGQSIFLTKHLLRVQFIDNVPMLLFSRLFVTLFNLTCVSDRLSCLASSVRSRPTTYWHRWNSSSSRYSCSAVNEVRVRLGRSRSRPFGSTISRMVPLASVRKNTTTTKHKDEIKNNQDTIN